MTRRPEREITGPSSYVVHIETPDLSCSLDPERALDYAHALDLMAIGATWRGETSRSDYLTREADAIRQAAQEPDRCTLGQCQSYAADGDVLCAGCREDADEDHGRAS